MGKLYHKSGVDCQIEIYTGELIFLEQEVCRKQHKIFERLLIAMLDQNFLSVVIFYFGDKSWGWAEHFKLIFFIELDHNFFEQRNFFKQ